jgi:hypothetical protein
VLKAPTVRLFAMLLPRVRAAWPAILAVALAVVLAHSGVQHLDAGAALAAHYREAIGTDEWTRTIGIAQLLAAGGLTFRRTRVATASVLAAALLLAMANQFRAGRIDAVPGTLVLLAWAVAIAFGEARRAGSRAGP